MRKEPWKLVGPAAGSFDQPTTSSVLPQRGRGSYNELLGNSRARHGASRRSTGAHYTSLIIQKRHKGSQLAVTRHDQDSRSVYPSDLLLTANGLDSVWDTIDVLFSASCRIARDGRTRGVGLDADLMHLLHKMRLSLKLPSSQAPAVMSWCGRPLALPLSSAFSTSAEKRYAMGLASGRKSSSSGSCLWKREPVKMSRVIANGRAHSRCHRTGSTLFPSAETSCFKWHGCYALYPNPACSTMRVLTLGATSCQRIRHPVELYDAGSCP